VAGGGTAALNAGPSRPSRIELDWPLRDEIPVQDENGVWTTIPEDHDASYLRSLDFREEIGSVGSNSVVVAGELHESLWTLRKMVGGLACLAYADIPRIEGFDESRAFQGEPGRRWAVWLTLVETILSDVRRLLAPHGVLVCQVGDLEEPFARLLLLQLLGRENYIGTIVWNSHYSAKGGKETREIAATHESLICFSVDHEALRPVALSVIAEGFSNPDGDPRGPWEARQKDAGRDTAKIVYNIPPYRWHLLSGTLPPGVWRVSPFSGVIWGVPSQPGSFEFVVEVSDSVGATAARELTIYVEETPSATLESDVWWVDGNVRAEGHIEFEDSRLPTAALGVSYHAVLRAHGGEPFRGTKRPSRGWAFGRQSLVDAVLEDRCYFGRNGTAIPERKRYAASLEGGVKPMNVTSWWDGKDVAWTQDATKHLKSLQDSGILKTTIGTAKPEKLMARLLEIFTREGELVVELFSRAGDLAATAAKSGRRFVAILGRGPSERDLLQGCVIPRLRAVVEGHDLGLDGQGDAAPSDPSRVLVYELGPTALVQRRGSDFPELTLEVDSRFGEAFLSSQGFIMAERGEDGTLRGVSLDGSQSAILVPPDVFLSSEMMAGIVSEAGPAYERTNVYYFRSFDVVDNDTVWSNVVFKRVPMDVSV
jgi:hypothetical protein